MMKGCSSCCLLSCGTGLALRARTARIGWREPIEHRGHTNHRKYAAHQFQSFCYIFWSLAAHDNGEQDLDVIADQAMVRHDENCRSETSTCDANGRATRTYHEMLALFDRSQVCN